MPANVRVKTKYPGVVFIEGTSVDGKPERIYYIRYRKDGKLIEEKAGRQFQDDMTPARAAMIRTQRINGDQLSNKERRESLKAQKEAEAGRWTVDRLWNEYKKMKHDFKSLRTDESRYQLYLKDSFGNKEPREILQLDTDRLRINLLKKRSPQTVRHVLGLLKRIANFGFRKGLCRGLEFRIEMPRVNNLRTEDLTPEQLTSLFKAIEEDTNIDAKNIMKLALYTGMRRGELFRLKWTDIDFERGFIHIRDPKGGVDQKIPLNDSAREVLLSHKNSYQNQLRDSEYIFPGLDGKQRVTVTKAVNRIKKRAGLPEKFRPMHGLRHTFASLLASSGQVDMYTLQKLLTHKEPRMTMRYAHLRDDALKKASECAGRIISESVESVETREEIKVVNLNDYKE